MELAVSTRASRWSGALPRPALPTALLWLLAGGLVLYLGIDGGGYDLIVHTQAAIVVWWVVLLGAAWGLLPRARLGRTAWAGLLLLGGFTAWTALATTWSASTERSLDSLALVAGYLGVLVLALSLMPDRAAALRQVTAAVSAAIVVIAALGVASRLRPDLFPAAHQTSSFLPGTQARLAWPLNYWNALACLVAIGLPLLWAQTMSARSLRWQAAAAGALPLLVLGGYLTFSRGGAIAVAAGLIVFIVLAPDRPAALLTGLIGAGGGAVLVLGAHHRSALERGLNNAAARHQGQSLLLALILVCGGAAAMQYGLGRVVRHAERPPLFAPGPRRARWVTLAVGVAAVCVALAVGVPHRLSHVWSDFKHPTSAGLHVDSLSRFGQTSGNGRYDYWKVAVNASSGHLLTGRGPGTFQLTWLPRAPYDSYVQNAHSLYFETLSEVGLVGLVLLGGFLLLALGVALATVVHSRYETRARAAGAAAAMAAFCVSAAFDWDWQVPVLPTCFLLLAAAVFSAWRSPVDGPVRRRTRTVLRAGFALAAVACLVAAAYPLAATTALRNSQSAGRAGDEGTALRAALQATRIEPAAASAQLQLALVQEARHDLPASQAAAEHATRDEPQNWATWLVLSRVAAESGSPRAALDAYRHARALNPHSSLFAGT